MLGKNPPLITSDTLNLDFVGLEIDFIGLEIVLNAAARLELNVVLLLGLGGVPVVGSGLVGWPGWPPSGMICMRKSVPAWGLLRVIMSLIMSISSLGELEGMDKSGRLEEVEDRVVEEELSGETVERRIEKEVGDERVGEGGVLGCCCCCCCCCCFRLFRCLGTTRGGSVPIASVVGPGILHGGFELVPG